MKLLKACGFVVAMVLLTVGTAPGQVAGKWGLGGGVAYTNPLFTFGERFGSGVDKWGLTASYVSSSRVTLEAEYHHAEMDNGALETKEFSWSPKALTVNEYVSEELNPAGSYTNRFNSVLISGLWFFNADRTMGEGSFSPYVVVGGGFYDHKTVADHIVWPGQSPTEAESVDPTNLDAQGNILPQMTMNRQEDTRTAGAARGCIAM